jgi:hypothetical protein
VKKRFSSSAALAFLIAILGIAFFTMAVFVVNPARLWDWSITLGATLVSALFAIATGLALFNYQNRITNEERERQLYTALFAELMDIKRILSRKPTVTFTMDGDVVETLLVDLAPVVLDKVARSGLVEDRFTTSSLLLAKRMREHNLMVSYLLAVSSTRLVTEATKTTVKSLVDELTSLRGLVARDAEMMMGWLRAKGVAEPNVVWSFEEKPEKAQPESTEN